MKTISDFYELDAWKESKKLTLLIYKETKKFPRDERYGLIDQIRRATVSIMANVAEGFGRYHFADKIRFYYQARGSLKEVQNFIFLSKELNYLSEANAKLLWIQSKNTEKLINGLIRSAEKQINRQ